MSETDALPGDALSVAQATIPLIADRAATLKFNLIVALTLKRDFSDDAVPPEIDWLVSTFVDGLLEAVAAGEITPTLRRPLADVIDRLGRAHIPSAFRAACHRSLEDRSAGIVVSAWCELVNACCAALPLGT